MAREITDFVEGDFAQGPKLRKAYKFQKDIWSGICFGLMCEWFNALMIHDLTEPDEILDYLDENFRLAGGRQEVMSDGWAVSKTGTWTDVASALTQMGRHWGYEFEYDETGISATELRAFLRHSPETGLYFLYITFHGGGAHAIGFLLLEAGIVFFDPNYGIGGLDVGPDAGDFSRALFRAYSATNGGIKKFVLFGVYEQATVRDFWQELERSR